MGKVFFKAPIATENGLIFAHLADVIVDENKLKIDKAEYRLLDIKDVFVSDDVNYRENKNSQFKTAIIVCIILSPFAIFGGAIFSDLWFLGLLPFLFMISLLFDRLKPSRISFLRLEAEWGFADLLKYSSQGDLEALKGAIFSAISCAQAKQRLLERVGQNYGRISLVEAAQVMKVNLEDAQELLDQFVKDKNAKLEFDADNVRIYCFPFISFGN